MRPPPASPYLRLALVSSLTFPLFAQVPNPNRVVHPSIAPLQSGAILHGTSPIFQYPDSKWNNGEGFAPSGTADEDYAGWFFAEDGTDVTSADVHTPNGWQSTTWQSETHPAAPGALKHLVGYLRPAGLALPTTHPLYGPLGTTYVDQGAFEIFRPDAAPAANDRILIVINCFQTIGFPKDNTGSSPGWGRMYRGIFSPDGLVRDEPLGQPRNATTFLNNNVLADVERPLLSPLLTIPASSGYYPLLAYPVLTVPGRQTTLNEQRYMQLVQAIKEILQESSTRNPLSAPLTAQELEDRVVVVFIGGSNGGFQSSWAAQRFPEIVHGCFAEVINPSTQRLYGEHDLGYAYAHLSGSVAKGAEVSEGDFLTWNQYAWSEGIEVHDLSYLRNVLRQAAGGNKAYRPACFMIGDEDITSTGTDWISVIEGASNWVRSGITTSPFSLWSTAATFGWSSAENTGHNNGWYLDPYNPSQPETLERRDLCHGLFQEAIAVRDAELASAATIPNPALTHEARASELRGFDDPHEWALGRLGEPLPAVVPTDPLVRDDAFFDAAQPGAAGTKLANREAMLIHEGHVYVGSAEGIVSKFHVVDAMTDPKQPFSRDAQSQPLGHGAYGLAILDASTGSSLIVGTRRHLHKLDLGTLAITAQSPILPWEVAQPHSIKVADVLQSNPGKEIVFASVHGGLCFYTEALQPIYEYPEPGIVDFEISGSIVSILSRRGMLANLDFATLPPELSAASASLPRNLVDYSATFDPWLDSPSQGAGFDLERMSLNFGQFGVEPGFVSLWDGDSDRLAVRCHHPDALYRFPFYVDDIEDVRGMLGGEAGAGGVDLAVCQESGSNPVGNHLLILVADNMMLFDQFGTQLGRKQLSQTAQGFYPFGYQTSSMAVGELVANSGDDYQQEVVVATHSGALMWLHVQDVVGTSSTVLPATDVAGAYGSGYWLDLTANGVAAAATQTQPRTNATLSSTWAMARVPGTDELAVVDQHGGYFRVDYNGNATMRERDRTVSGSRGLDYLGIGAPDLLTLDPNGFPSQYFGSANAATPVAGLSQLSSLAYTFPWTAIEPILVKFEQTMKYVACNWIDWSYPVLPKLGIALLDGFVVHRLGGSLVTTATSSGSQIRETWFWSSRPVDWGNLVEAIRIDTDTTISPADHDVTGVWASTLVPNTAASCAPATGDQTPHLDLRDYSTLVPASTHQGVQAVQLATGSQERVVILGCPGGRVRVLENATMRDVTNPTVDHVLGSLSKSDDFGYGSSLAVRHEVSGSSELVRIWTGSLYGPTPRPASYDSATGALADGEVAAGAIHMMTWTPGSGLSASLQTIKLTPSVANPRGGYAIVGMKVVDLLPDVGAPLDELVVCTLAGDVIVYTIGSSGKLSERWRTFVSGAAGFYGSILAEDLNGDGYKELYLGGSLGLWRFIQPTESEGHR
ncbi:MAG: hypothetical protein KDE27_12720 [Planctomycetes bacterium]|nr:hypothetical protein [Planctomycetota bacterium]